MADKSTADGFNRNFDDFIEGDRRTPEEQERDHALSRGWIVEREPGRYVYTEAGLAELARQEDEE